MEKIIYWECRRSFREPFSIIMPLLKSTGTSNNPIQAEHQMVHNLQKVTTPGKERRPTEILNEGQGTQNG